MIPPHENPDSLDTRSLAFLGDAIMSLLARDMLIRQNVPPGQLHDQAASIVCARSQAQMFHRIQPELNEEEQDIVRRARNRSGRGPRGSQVTDYVQATGFEALIGWLAVKGRGERLLDIWRKSQT